MATDVSETEILLSVGIFCLELVFALGLFFPEIVVHFVIILIIFYDFWDNANLICGKYSKSSCYQLELHMYMCTWNRAWPR